jgi:NTP pyrophosphatase (non-canonical NTP hydrolase)
MKNKLTEENLKSDELIVYNGALYRTGNRYHDLVELYDTNENLQYIVKMSKILRFSDLKSPALIQEIQDDIAKWSNETFTDSKSNYRLVALVSHLLEEAKEVRYEINKYTEHNFAPDEKIMQKSAILSQCADCEILIMDLLAKLGFSTDDLLKAILHKMEVNKTRQWEGPNKDGLYHHK